MEDLCSAYLKYGESLNFNSTLLTSADGHMIVKFTGQNVWQAFQHESGKHVVQRCPPTENKGRRHTSVISVAVLPLLEKNFQSLPENELKTITQGGHGKGGQFQNARDSAVRMTHIPTGINVFINGRKQLQNKKEALRIITTRVNNHYMQQKQTKHDSVRKSQMAGGNRSGKIRTYNFIRSEVVDHRLGTRTSNIHKIMQGHFGLILQ